MLIEINENYLNEKAFDLIKKNKSLIEYLWTHGLLESGFANCQQSLDNPEGIWADWAQNIKSYDDALLKQLQSVSEFENMKPINSLTPLREKIKKVVFSSYVDKLLTPEAQSLLKSLVQSELKKINNTVEQLVFKININNAPKKAGRKKSDDELKIDSFEIHSGFFNVNTLKIKEIEPEAFDWKLFDKVASGHQLTLKINGINPTNNDKLQWVAELLDKNIYIKKIQEIKGVQQIATFQVPDESNASELKMLHIKKEGLNIKLYWNSVSDAQLQQMQLIQWGPVPDQSKQYSQIGELGWIENTMSNNIKNVSIYEKNKCLMTLRHDQWGLMIEKQETLNNYLQYQMQNPIENSNDNELLKLQKELMLIDWHGPEDYSLSVLDLLNKEHVEEKGKNVQEVLKDLLKNHKYQSNANSLEVQVYHDINTLLSCVLDSGIKKMYERFAETLPVLQAFNDWKLLNNRVQEQPKDKPDSGVYKIRI